jgi:phosphatidylglycerophosphate synthase
MMFLPHHENEQIVAPDETSDQERKMAMFVFAFLCLAAQIVVEGAMLVGAYERVIESFIEDLPKSPPGTWLVAFAMTALLSATLVASFRKWQKLGPIWWYAFLPVLAIVTTLPFFSKDFLALIAASWFRMMH